MRIEYQLGVTLVSAFLVVVTAFLFKLALLPNTTTVPVTQPAVSSPSKVPEMPPDNNNNAVTFGGSMTAQEYASLYKQSLEKPTDFWGRIANDTLTWSRPFTTVFEPGKEMLFDGFKWFSDGQLNACFNAVDRHAQQQPDKAALIWEPNDPQEETITITFKELHVRVQQVANYLKTQCGVRKGDRVTIYMPQVPETLFAILACARLGAVHNVVFAGFAAESLRSRIIDSQSKVLLTVNGFHRGTKFVEMKGVVDEALVKCPLVSTVIVLKRVEGIINVMKEGRDVWWHESITKAPENCDIQVMDAEDPLFILYTSGSTGKPKALLHTTAGYLTYAAYTFKTMFDYKPDDVYFLTADAGWITGHSYGIYGPLINGATMVWMEGVPTHPTNSRLWEIINKHKVSTFYTAPTLLRMLKRLGDEHVLECTSLRVLGTVGEPIDPPSWKWYYEVVGRKRCAIVDTYWQTETGGHLISTIPGTAPIVPGHAGLPFMGIEPEIVPFTANDSNPDNHGVGALVIKRPWPGMARTIYNDHERYKQVYLMPHPGSYYTGDGASRDENGNFRIHGRIDDVINVSAHRIATAEVEGALTRHTACSEAAVLGKPDDITGECIMAFCLLKPEYTTTERVQLEKELKDSVRRLVGPIAVPRRIYFPNDLPKTRSGKIMRRVLRKLLVGDTELGDLSTLTNPDVVDEIRTVLKQ